MHCFEVVAYRHPDDDIAVQADEIYRKIVHSLHLSPELPGAMYLRLSEDRVS